MDRAIEAQFCKIMRFKHFNYKKKKDSTFLEMLNKYVQNR